MFNKKKKIRNVAQLDLRNYTAQALSKISAIENVAIILLPENPSAEFTVAYAEIDKVAIANEIPVPSNKKTALFNGGILLSGANIPNDSICFVNGSAIIYNTKNVVDTSFIVNGFVLVEKDANINFQTANGAVLEANVDFDFDKLKFYPSEITVDSVMIKNLEKDASVAAGGRMKIDNTVTEAEVVEKNLTFIAGGEIVCSKNIAGCIKARSIVGGRIKENG